MQLLKTNFQSILEKNQKFILFGSDNLISSKTINILGKDKIQFIFDNSKNLDDTYYEGIKVKFPEKINKDFFIVICSTAIGPISNQLIKAGLIPNENFAVSPYLNDRLAIYQLENLHSDFYFTSGSMPEKESKYGGGFYKISLKGEKIKIKKLYSGSCYGTFKNAGLIYFVDCDNGVMCYNTFNNQINNLFKTPKASRAHGLSINNENENLYVTCSNLDATIEYDNKFNELRRFRYSEKIDFYNKPMHHANDNFSIGNSLYISMFSETGNWRNDVFDGCILEFDLITGKKVGVLTKDLYMPHNVTFINDSIHVLDSLPGHLKFNNFKIQGTFSAFTRGLSYNNNLYFVGQSKNRNYSKVQGISNNISIDCGVIIFDPETKISRFIQLPMKIGEIHSIVH